ncbi:UNVERIFIED_CONTAM: hypothetical protein Sindi_1615400 [Sesamum indicum]
MQGKFNNVDVPFLIGHDGDDIVCASAYMKNLYNSATNKDKTLRIYPRMWHLLVGESDENVALVFEKAVDWRLTRVEGGI